MKIAVSLSPFHIVSPGVKFSLLFNSVNAYFLENELILQEDLSDFHLIFIISAFDLAELKRRLGLLVCTLSALSYKCFGWWVAGIKYHSFLFLLKMDVCILSPF